MTDRQTSHSFEHAARTLSLGEVLELVAAGCVNEAARATVSALRPTADRDGIVASLGEIDEYRRLRDEAGDLAVPDVSYRDAVEKIAAGERAGAGPLYRVGAGERAVSGLRRSVAERREAFPRLAAIAAALEPHDDLAETIERAIDPDGSIRDDASPALKKIRRDIRMARENLRERADRLVGDLGADAHATVMSGRHVLVVPRAKVKRGSGLVHAASHTGGSLYVEPFALVELNNELETRLSDEAEEMDRILVELSDRVRREAPAILANADGVERIDAVRAKAAFAERFGCITPEVSATGRLRLVRGRHPLLALALERAGQRETAVPLDLSLEPGLRLLVITGPNAGGKTVAIKTVGLCALMLQCGLQVPCAHGSELPVFDQVFADIGDEQSLDSSLSTFTSHLKHLDEMSRLANERTLCLVDEIGDGTDPDEGAALAIATLEKLLASRAAVVATTHYGRIKTFALETEGVTNASMAFAEEEARPLYRLLQGVAGRSRGVETARRTGFDATVVRRAEAILGGEAFRLEAALARLETTHAMLEKEREALSAQRAEVERTLASYREKEQAYTLTRREATRRAMREAEEMLAQTRREIESIVRSLRERGGDKAAVRESRRRVDSMLSEVRAKGREGESTASPLASVAPGDRVSLSPTGRPWGTVVEVGRREATVDLGDKRLRAPLGKLYPAAPESPTQAAVRFDVEYEPLGESTLDVHGYLREDALAEVSRFVDRAVLTGLHEVKIIHGLGEGILARAVREALARDPRVASVRAGNSMEGGAGVTFARLQ